MDRRLATSTSSGERMAWVKFGIEVALAVAAVYMMKTYIAGKVLSIYNLSEICLLLYPSLFTDDIHLD